MTTALSQPQAQEVILPILKEKGRNYRNIRSIYARPAKDGDQCPSLSGNGTETMQTARSGDFVCKNQSGGNEYLIQSGEFSSNYEDSGETSVGGSDNFRRYNPKGQVVACEITSEIASNLNSKGINLPCTIQGANGNSMSLNIGDYVTSPIGATSDGSIPPVNCMSREDFNSTYGG